MNSDVLTLLKIELAKFLSGFSNKKKIRQTPIFYIALLIFGLGLLMSASYSFLFISPYVRSEVDPAPATALFAGISCMLTFMSTLSQSRSIYIGDDYDLLSTLPIKKRDIVTSKILSLYIIELVFSFIVMVPHGIIMLLYAQNTALGLISFLLAFTLPIVPIALAVLVSIIVTMATSRFKAANVVFVVLYAIVIVGISALAMLSSNLKDDQSVTSFSALGNVIKWINPAYIFIELGLNVNRLYLLGYIGVTLVVGILSVIFIVVSFDKLHEIVSSISMKKTYVRKDLKNKSEGKLLLSLQFKRLVNSKMYFVNTIMGGLMAILGCSVFLFSYTQGMAKAEGDSLVVMKAILLPIYISIAIMIFGISNPITSTINIEGKNFWLMKSLPIDYRKLMKAQLLFSWIITIPASLIGSTIATIFYHEDALAIVFTYLIPILFNIFISLLNLVIALHHVNLKWNSETEAVKNSKAAVISMFMNWGLMTVIAPPIIIFPILLPQLAWLGYLIGVLSIIIPSIPVAIYLHRYYPKRIELIEDL